MRQFYDFILHLESSPKWIAVSEKVKRPNFERMSYRWHCLQLAGLINHSAPSFNIGSSQEQIAEFRQAQSDEAFGKHATNEVRTYYKDVEDDLFQNTMAHCGGVVTGHA